MPPSPARSVAAAQGAYFLLTGVAPFVSRRGFEAVTGPKREWWLVQTVGGVVTALGGALAGAAGGGPAHARERAGGGGDRRRAARHRRRLRRPPADQPGVPRRRRRAGGRPGRLGMGGGALTPPPAHSDCSLSRSVARNCAAATPSSARWSHDSPRMHMGRIAIESLPSASVTTTARLTTASRSRIATCG